jgi:hypothetical protein
VLETRCHGVAAPAPLARNCRWLFVGAEHEREFAQALRLAETNREVIVVNPRESVAARRFSDAGGTFIPTAVDRLPLALGPFDCVCENYPFTVRRIKGLCEDDPCPVWRSSRAMRQYAMARLRRVAPGGRWIVFTESPGFARALRSLVHRDPTVARAFTVRIVSLSKEEAPLSLYPRLTTRFKVVVQRRCSEKTRSTVSGGKAAI